MTVFVGDNAQGKTSILESACILLRLQSPRTTSLQEVIRFEERSFAVEGELDDTRLQIGYSQSRRKLVVDGETQSRSGDYLARSGVLVWMANDDLDLVRRGGERRRKFLDFMGSQLYPAYRPALRSYEQALRRRNHIFKRDPKIDWNQVDAYTELLVEHGQVLLALRAEMVEALEPLAAEAQTRVSGENDNLGLQYLPSSRDAELGEAYAASREEELRKRVTVVGPHRDDLVLMVHGRPADAFASEGQQRTVALAMKLGQAALLRQRRGDDPILMVDDIFGELDKERRNALMQALPAGSQKLVTTTHLDWLQDFEPDAIFRVADGGIATESP